MVALSIKADEVPTLGSSSFTLECFGHELPWEARLVSVSWYKSGTQLSPNDSVSTENLRDSYSPSAFKLMPLTYSEDGRILIGH